MRSDINLPRLHGNRRLEGITGLSKIYIFQNAPNAKTSHWKVVPIQARSLRTWIGHKILCKEYFLFFLRCGCKSYSVYIHPYLRNKAPISQGDHSARSKSARTTLALLGGPLSGDCTLTRRHWPANSGHSLPALVQLHCHVCWGEAIRDADKAQPIMSEATTQHPI